VVWFGETLDEFVLQQAFAKSQACDVMLIVGTSGVVTPAAWLPSQASRSGARIVEVNPVPSALTPLTDLYLAGPAGEVLPRVVEQMAVTRRT
jgi:NAD-dependent deacetylase